MLLIPPLLVPIALNVGPLAHLLARPLPEYLGRVSYSLYITHYVVLAAMRFLFQVPRIKDNLWLTFACTLVEVMLIYAVARFTYHFIEEPGRKWLTRSSRRRGSVVS